MSFKSDKTSKRSVKNQTKAVPPEHSEAYKKFWVDEASKYPFEPRLNKKSFDSADPKSFELALSLARVNSRKYLKAVRELEILIAGLQDKRDSRITDIEQWLETQKNILLDLGISPDLEHHPDDQEIQKRAMQTYLRDYDQQQYPYITNQGHAVPVNFLSAYLSGIKDNVPDFLGPTKRLQDMFNLRKRIIGNKANELNQYQTASEYLEMLMNAPTVEVPDIFEAKEFKAEILGILKKYERFLETINNVYDYILSRTANALLKIKDPVRTPRIEHMLKQISQWQFNRGDLHQIVDQEAFKEYLLPKIKFPAGFKQKWLPFLNTFKTFKELTNVWQETENYVFLQRKRLANAFSMMGINQYQDMQEAMSVLLQKHEEKLKKLERSMDPFYIYRFITKNPGYAINDFIQDLLAISFTVYEFEFDHNRLVKWLVENPGKDKPDSFSIDPGEKGYLENDVREMIGNMQLLPQAFAKLHEVEQEIMDIYEGKKTIKRKFSLRQILTHYLLPREQWVKNLERYCAELHKQNIPLREKIHTFINKCIFQNIFCVETTDENLKNTISEFLAEVSIVAPESMKTIDGFLKKYLDLRKPAPEVYRYLQEKIFLVNHNISFGELLLKLYKQGLDPFEEKPVQTFLRQKQPSKSFRTNDNIPEYVFQGISDKQFEDIVAAMQNFSNGEINHKMRQEIQLLREKILTETQTLLDERKAKEGTAFGTAEQFRFMEARNQYLNQKIAELMDELKPKEEESEYGTNIYSENYLKQLIRKYLDQQNFWMEEAFNLSLIEMFSLPEQNLIMNLLFEMITEQTNRLRFSHRFEEKSIPDPFAQKNVWPVNPVNMLPNKKDLPELSAKNRDELEIKEKDPINTPETIKTILTIAELIDPNLFALQKGNNPVYKGKRRFNQNPLQVLVVPAGAHALREIPQKPYLFLARRGRSLGNISNYTGFHAKQYEQDITYLYAGSYYDPKHSTIVISADADDANLLYYFKDCNYWENNNKVFSSILMSLGQMRFHNLPEHIKYGAKDIKEVSWKACLMQSRAYEINSYNRNKEERLYHSTQSSGLSYNIPLDEMKFDDHLMALEFGSYYSEIVMELISGRKRNMSRPPVVDNFFYVILGLSTLPNIEKAKQNKIDSKHIINYERNREIIQDILDKYLGLKKPEISYLMPGAKLSQNDLLSILAGTQLEISEEIKIRTTLDAKQKRNAYRKQFSELERNLIRQDEQALRKILEGITEPETKNKLKIFDKKTILKQAALLYFILSGELQDSIARQATEILEMLEEQERITIIRIYAAYFKQITRLKYFEPNIQNLKQWAEPIIGESSKEKIREMFNNLNW